MITDRRGPVTATREELAGHAERNGADRGLVEALRNLGNDAFDGPKRREAAAQGLPDGSRD